MPPFRALIKKVGPGYWIDVPADIMARLDGARHRPVIVRYAGDAHASTVTADRSGTGRLALHADVFRSAGYAVGDTIEVTLTPDPTPRMLTVPPELARALAFRPAAKAGWETAAPSTRRVVVEQFNNLRSPEARVRRIEKLVEHFAERAAHRAQPAKSRSKSA